MRVAVTGTPGTGKTTATDLVASDLEVVHLNEVIETEGLTEGVDEERGSVVADLDAVAAWLDGRDDVVFESHLAHHLDADRVVVLRAHPDEIVERLSRRGNDEDSARKARENAASPEAPRALARKTRENAQGTKSPRALARKARENAESEALDVILSEAVERHGLESVFEIDTMDRTPAEVAAEIDAVVAGEREPSAGTVSYLEWL